MPAQKTLVVQKLRHKHSLEILLSIAQLPRATFYYHLKQKKQELVEYLDYYNNRRIKAKLKGLPPAIHRQQALSAA